MNDEVSKCGRESEGYLIWPGQGPMPMCAYHKEGLLKLGRMMSWPVTFTTGDAGPCESADSHPDDPD